MTENPPVPKLHFTSNPITSQLAAFKDKRFDNVVEMARLTRPD